MTTADHNTRRARDLLAMMERIRAFEEQACLAAERDKLVLGAIHPSIGQEGVAVGVMCNFNRDDMLLSTHRGHGHTLAKGADPLAMMRELLGREGGCCGGKGGSMHIADFGVGMLGANGVVGANITIAAGAAHGLKLQGSDRIVVDIFGDGAINRGPFLEGVNWASVFDLPILFVCEDNQYSATTRTSSVTGGPGAAARAQSLGLRATTVDGNDAEAVADVTAEITARIRAGGGPEMLHAITYRRTGHTSFDPAGYRPKGESEHEAKTNDPIARQRAVLAGMGLSTDELDAIHAAAQSEMVQVLADAAATPFPADEMALQDVQDIGSPAQEAY
ncbi:thiamine pyrophosphate-dependent dehydrogenase E1 component subunit alpha [Profundibacter sp.]|uniref:thiamine pyrophosphate-dependent dehydrogenase E1 component subunit alpha n=1 Tax=Profundibacter sp. TaxID=3101071 RepID=UPI003D136C5B